MEESIAPAPRYIVGETSKNWRNQQPLSPGLLSQNIELILKEAAGRGYAFRSVATAQSVYRDDVGDLYMVETAIVVCEREAE